jgi:DNA-binding MarR family transcriptional regulator
METFKKFQKVKSILGEIQGIKTYKDFDILIEIGYHQEAGCPLTLKQLMLLKIASQATVRRYLSNLVRDGMVEKFESADDQRSVMLRLSASTVKTLSAQFSKIIKHLVDPTVTSPKSRNSRNKKI